VVVDGSERVVVMSAASCALDGEIRANRGRIYAVNIMPRPYIPREDFIFANGRPDSKGGRAERDVLDRGRQ
jgi:hypothetical protein